MERISECLKILIEKHLIPTIISILVALIAVLFIPDENWMIVRLGKYGVGTLFFCGCFLLVELMIQVFLHSKDKIKHCKIKKQRIQEEKEMEEQNVNKKMKEINEFYDDLTSKDKDIVLTFVKNKNKILIAFDLYYLEGNILDNKNIIYSSSFVVDDNNINKEKYWVFEDMPFEIGDGFQPPGGYKQYKLKDGVYNLFRLVYEYNGKLGNF